MQPEEGAYAMAHEPRLGRILLKAGVVDEFQLDAALQEHRRSGERLGTTLVRLGFVEESDLLKALATQLGLPIATLQRKKVDPEILDLVPREVAVKNAVLPLFAREYEGEQMLYVGMQDPSDTHAQQSVELYSGMSVKPVLVAASELSVAIQRLYPPITDLEELCGDRIPAETVVLLDQEVSSEDEASNSPDEGDTKASAARRGEADTRVILQALTKILIDKRLVGRDELLKRISDIELALEIRDAPDAS